MYMELVESARVEVERFQEGGILVEIEAVMEDYSLIFYHMLCWRYKQLLSLTQAIWIDFSSY